MSDCRLLTSASRRWYRNCALTAIVTTATVSNCNFTADYVFTLLLTLIHLVFKLIREPYVSKRDMRPCLYFLYLMTLTFDLLSLKLAYRLCLTCQLCETFAPIFCFWVRSPDSVRFGGGMVACRTGNCDVAGSTLARCATRQQPWRSCSLTCASVHQAVGL